MPYVIAIDEGVVDGVTQTVFYAGPGRPFVSFVETATHYDDLPYDHEVLQARGFDAYVEVVA